MSETPLDTAIIQWCANRRPDLVNYILGINESTEERGEALRLLLAVGFEAGRHFQIANPDCPPGPIVLKQWNPVF